jgi:hypothetical protein
MICEWNNGTETVSIAKGNDVLKVILKGLTADNRGRRDQNIP